MRTKVLGIIAVLNMLSLGAYAQMSVAPNGLSSFNAPPVGAKKSGGDCATGNCIEFNLIPACFGTNLRAYNASTQMKDNENVKTVFTLKKDNKTDTLEIIYPATLTFDTGNLRRDCSINSINGTNAEIQCQKVGSEQAATIYKISTWKQDKNPSCYANGGSHGQTYCDYAGVLVDALRYTNHANMDSNIKCLYNFNSNYGLDTDKVSCMFESDATDRASEVIVKLNGVDISNSVDKSAFVNDIKLKISNNFNSMNLQSVVHHGKLQPIKTPEVDIDFFQGTNDRNIAEIIEESNFDPTNGNRSYTLSVKHPGVEGFCGGFYSPLMFFFDQKLPKFDGVSLFPLFGTKPGDRVYWPEKGAPGYFLVHMQGKKRIESNNQLFGQNEKFDHGFDSLAVYDLNHDGVIDKKDKVFKKLKLWKDKNSNGISDKGEIISLADKGVVSISLDYTNRKPSNFAERARAREKSKFSYLKDGKEVKGDVFDVWLAPLK